MFLVTLLVKVQCSLSSGSVFGLQQLTREIFVFLSDEYSTLLTGWLQTVTERNHSTLHTVVFLRYFDLLPDVCEKLNLMAKVSSQELVEAKREKRKF